jgi:hypothetical protein
MLTINNFSTTEKITFGGKTLFTHPEISESLCSFSSAPAIVSSANWIAGDLDD